MKYENLARVVALAGALLSQTATPTAPPSKPQIPDAQKIAVLKAKSDVQAVQIQLYEVKVSVQQLQSKCDLQPEMVNQQAQWNALINVLKDKQKTLDAASTTALKAAGVDPEKYDIGGDDLIVLPKSILPLPTPVPVKK